MDTALKQTARDDPVGTSAAEGSLMVGIDLASFLVVGSQFEALVGSLLAFLDGILVSLAFLVLASTPLASDPLASADPLAFADPLASVPLAFADPLASVPLAFAAPLASAVS